MRLFRRKEKQHWSKFFDRIFVISLPKRKDRRDVIGVNLHKYGIDFSFWMAKESLNGADGLKATLLEILDVSQKNGWNNILIFEDDAHFIENPNLYMPSVLKELPHDYDMLYLGCNPLLPFCNFHSKHLLPLHKAYALHAVCYSLSGMKKVLGIPHSEKPMDVLISDQVLSQGNCYCTFPLLSTQLPGISDIEKRHVDWSHVIQKRFKHQTSSIVNNETVSGHNNL